MSHQFNESTEFEFELFGDIYELIEPRNLEELVEALRIKELLQQGIDSHEPDSGHPYYHLHKTQETWISEYVSQLGDFDNSIMSKNISFLTKKNGIGIGDLEKILGISTGYISRTAKGNSGKKMSIDNVWKIARLFGVELRTLLETDLQIPNKNTELIVNFMEKLRLQTENNSITWINRGGVMCELDKQLSQMTIFSEGEEETEYKVKHLNPLTRFVLANDIYSCKGVIPNNEIFIVSYIIDGNTKSYHADFYLANSDMFSINVCKFEKMFFTIDDCCGTLDSFSQLLLNQIQQQEMDATLTPDMKSLIADYLK